MAINVRMNLIPAVRWNVFSTALLDRDIRAIRENLRRQIQSEVQQYPPSKAGSDYERTGNLGRSWGIRNDDSRGQLSIIATNNQRYARFVHGDYRGHGQQFQHTLTGWRITKDIMDVASRFLYTDLNLALKKDLP